MSRFAFTVVSSPEIQYGTGVGVTLFFVFFAVFFRNDTVFSVKKKNKIEDYTFMNI